MASDLLQRAAECMAWAEIPLQSAMRHTPTIRDTNEPPPNIHVQWWTNYSSAQEFLAVLGELRAEVAK